MPDVVVWGRRPPPLGGVTRCVQGLSTALVEAGVDHVVIDWRERGALRHMVLSRRALHVHNVSSVLRLAFVMVAKALSGASTVVYFHSGTLPEQLRSPLRQRIARWGFRWADEVWTTNAKLVDVITEVAGVSATIVSPYSKTLTRAANERAANSIVLFVGYGKDLYGLELALEAKRDDRLTAWSWTVIAYGDDESCDRVRERAEGAGCLVRVNLDADEIAETLAAHAVLLRPTSADGDAMVVREAMAAGMRVIASDVVPRPRGAEIFALTATDLVDALTVGGRPSSGAGLGMPVSDQVLTALAGSQGS